MSIRYSCRQETNECDDTYLPTAMVRRMKKQHLKQESTTDQNILLDAFAALLAICGTSQDAANGKRETFRSSLRSLAKSLVKRRDRQDEMPLPSDQFLNLVQIEEEAQRVRENGESFVASLQDERTEATLLAGEIEDVCRSKDDVLLIRTNLFVKSLVDALYDQNWSEQVATERCIKSLEDIYVCEKATGLVAAQLIELANSLANRFLLETLQFQQGVTIYQNLESQEFGKPLGGLEYSLLLDQNPSIVVEDSVQQNNVMGPPPTTKAASDKRQRMLEAHDIRQAVSIFIKEGPNLPQSAPPATLMLLVGLSGCGKSHICNEIEKMATMANVNVIRPSLPLDIMGTFVGEVEDLVMSIFACAVSLEEKTIILLDDVEQITGLYSDGTPALGRGETPSHLVSRSRSALLSAFDALLMQQCTDLLIICTAKTDIGDHLGRFDKTFDLQFPTADERRGIIVSCLDVERSEAIHELPEDVERTLRFVVECTVGRSFAEVSQLCRETISSAVTSPTFQQSTATLIDSKIDLLYAMKKALEAATPDSLRQGSLSGFVDVRVYTARDLLRMCDTKSFPLYGYDAELAWNELESLIVQPLCHNDALMDILYHTGGARSGKTVCGGVLLTGPPGSGKSALAYYCAAVVAESLPSIRLLDVSCTSLIHKEVGGSEASVYQLFECARAAMPCILLMDGIENVAAVRGNDNTTEGTMDRVLSTLLTELDGISDNESMTTAALGGIAVIGITHNVNWIDPALKRPGRLGKVVRMAELDDEARCQIVINEIQGMALVALDECTANQVANLLQNETRGMTGAEIKSMCDEVRLFWAQLVSGGSIGNGSDRGNILARVQSIFELRNKASHRNIIDILGND